MPLSLAQSLQLNYYLDSHIRWKLGTEGKTQLIGVLSCNDAAQLLYDVFITNKPTITISRGAQYNVVTDDDGNITIELRSLALDSDDTMIDCILFEACNSKRQKGSSPKKNIMFGFNPGGGPCSTYSAAKGKRTGKWEAENMVEYVLIAQQIPVKYRTANMKKAIVKWKSAGQSDVAFISQQADAPHDSKMVTSGGTPTNRMGLSTKALYSYEYICKRKSPTTFINDIFYATFSCARGSEPVKGFQGKYESKTTGKRQYSTPEIEQSIKLADWVYKHWPKGKAGDEKPERVLLVHDTIKACRTQNVLNKFHNIKPEDFGLNNHTETIARSEASDKTRHTF